MKKKILIPILTGITTISAVTPVAILSSCSNKEKPTPVPVTPDTSFQWQINLATHSATITKFIGTETQIYIPSEYVKDNVTYTVTTIGNYAFNGCTTITSITIPNSIKNIESGAFNACKGLTSITIPNGVTTIGHYAFFWCTGLTSIIISSSVTSIVNGAFSKCTSLESIKIDPTNPNYTSQDSSSNECNCIIEKNTNKLIAGCKTTTIPNNITSIGDDAFEGCEGLTSITIPNSVTGIGEGTFEGCIGLTSITIPNSVTNIGIDAFLGCTKLASISYSGTKSQFTQITKGDNWHEGIATNVVHCTDGDLNI